MTLVRRYGAGITSASTATHPDSETIIGLTSSSAIRIAELDREDREAGDGARQRADVRRRRAPRAVQERTHRQAVDQAAGGVLVDRGEGELPVVQELHQDAARRHQHERSERRVAHDPERDLDAGGAISSTVTRLPSRFERSA